MAIPQSDIDRCGLSWAAKVVCTGVFVTGREPEEILRASCAWMAAPEDVLREAMHNRNPRALLALEFDVDVDRDKQLVRLGLNGVEAYARMHGDQGACVCDSPDMPLGFQPRAVTPSPRPQPPPWENATDSTPHGVRRALDLAFENSFQFTNALIVLHRGKLIAERYSAAFDADTQFEAWSMGKSIAATLVGVAERQGVLSLDEPAGFPEWQNAGDPRRDIKLRNLLNMASGLKFTGAYGTSEDPTRKSENGLFMDHTYVYAGGADSYQFCVNKPPADPPDTAGRYRNSDPLLATSLVRHRAAGGSVDAFLEWPQRNLFDPLGIEGLLLETDPFGHFLISGHDYGTARDWAKLGLLYLQRGAWQSEQLLNPSFVEFVQTPAAAAWRHDPYYGGFFATNATRVIPTLPKDAYWMSGGGRQRVVIVPSKELVIVRMGHMSGLLFGLDETLQEVYRQIVSSVD